MSTLDKAAAESPSRMEHVMCQGALRQMTALSLAIDLDAHLARLERAVSVGPLLDPSLWMAGREALAVELKVCRAAIAFRQAIGVEKISNA